MKKVFGLLLVCALLSACNPEIKEGKINRYFDLKGLIETQIKTLNTQKPFVQKTIVMSEKSESQLVKSIDWAKELELFIQTDLNKPAFIQSYQVDSSSKSVIYKLKDAEKLSIKYLTISKIGENGISIEALVSNENYLYQNEKHLKLFLKNNEVSDYQIEGFQKIVFGDRKTFKINGVIKR